MILQSEEGCYGVHDDDHNGSDDYMLVTIMCFPGFIIKSGYIKLPTVEENGIFVILAFSAFVPGHCVLDNLLFTGRVDPTNFASDMLNR